MSKESTLREMKQYGVPITRENFISFEWLGDAYPKEWMPEHESMLPDELQDWSLFEYVKGELRLKKGK